MVRRQIQLTESQDAAVRREAMERGLSIAAVIRRLVEESLRSGSDARRAAAESVIGRYSSGVADVAAEHDRHLEDVFDA
jgi:hypothetical protein